MTEPIVDEDIDLEAIEDARFEQELTEFVSTLPAPTADEMRRYEDKMAMLEQIRLDVFGPPKPIEWEHNDRIDYVYVEPFTAYKVSGSSEKYWQHNTKYIN